MKEELLKLFFDKYTNKEETMYRLPMSVDIEAFWPEELDYRKERGQVLPLAAYDGHPYFYVRTKKFLEAADRITELARSFPEDADYSEFLQDTVADEAFYSSSIEGAHSTCEQARKLISTGRKPKGKDEQMVWNNYNALTLVLSNLDEEISEDLILRIGEILTKDTLEAGTESGYRTEPVYIMSHTGQTIYTAPEAGHIRPMMEQLIAYLNDRTVHPIEKAVAAHAYFVTIHPFYDGNGRTARALTYMILLKAGYDFFRLVPISGLLAEERPKYYRALRSCQSTDTGYDFTYFSDYYADMLSRTLASVKSRLNAMEQLSSLETGLTDQAGIRRLEGARWMVTEEIGTITAEKWKNSFGVSFETARQDLYALSELGFLTPQRKGRKLIFMRV